MNSMLIEVRKDRLKRKSQTQLQHFSLPNAPPRKRQAGPSPERDPCPLMQSIKHDVKQEPETALEPKLEPWLDMEDIKQMGLDEIDADVKVDPLSASPKATTNSIDVLDGVCSATAEEWTRADGSDDELDVDYDQDACALAVPNATSVPASFYDMTKLQIEVLTTEDEANDKALRNLILDEDQYKFDWSRDQQTFTGRRETFTGTSGPTFDVTNMTPVDLFHKMFDKDFIDTICNETNRYAEQKIAMLRSKNVSLQSLRLHRWTPTNPDEMVSFLAVLVLMGLYPMPEEEKYFSFNGFGTMPYFSRIMSYNRFALLKSLYHFVNSQTTDGSELSTIQPVLDHLNVKYSTMYMPSQEISIYETLLTRHGCLSFARKIATKDAQVGVKAYELCESRSGYVWKFIVDAGEKTNDETNDETNEKNETSALPSSSVARSTNFNFTAKIVFDLVQPLLHRGHTIVMDNFYNSPLLLRLLKQNQTDCYGTLRLNREFVPDSLKTLNKTDLRHGEIVSAYCSDLSMMLWRESNLVCMISTYHQLQVGSKDKQNSLTYKPQIVLDYNKSMGGLDKRDQLLSANPEERLRNKVWHKKVFARFLSSSVFNLFVIYQTKHPKMTHRRFRIILAEGLLKRHAKIDLTTEPRLYTNRPVTRHAHANSRPKVDHDHFPVRSSAKRPRCWMCTQRKRDTRTIWKCAECDVNLCVEHCFRGYHKNLN